MMANEAVEKPDFRRSAPFPRQRNQWVMTTDLRDFGLFNNLNALHDRAARSEATGEPNGAAVGRSGRCRS